MDKLKWLIQELDKSTRRALIENQLNSIPIKYELVETINSIKELKAIKGKCYTFNTSFTMIRNTNFDSIIYGKLSDIATDSIKRVLLFDIDGNFIDLSKVKILIDERVCLFYPIDQNTIIKYCYICQDSIEYKEQLTEPRNYHIFFKNGKLEEFKDQSTGVFFNRLHIETGVTVDGFISSKIDREYNIFKENILLFKDGKLVEQEIVENLSNVFRVTDRSTEYRYIIIYSKEQKSIDNIVRYTKHINIVKDILNNVNLPEYINIIQDDFDFRYDPELSEQENKEKILNEILSYSHQNIDRLFTKDNSYILKQFTGVELRQKTDNNNLWMLPRLRVNNNINTHVIVFYNGELLDGYSNIKYIANNIMIPITKSRIKDSDIIEVMYFVDVKNNELDVNLSEWESFNYTQLASNMKDVLFYSNQLNGNHIYDLVEDPERHYILPYMYRNDNDNTAQILFENEFYHNKNIKAVSKRQFRHMKYQIPRENKHQLNYKWYNLKDYLLINPEPDTKEKFDILFSEKVGNIYTGGVGIIENQSPSFGDIVNSVYTNSTPTFLPNDRYALYISGYIYLELDSLYHINLISSNPCKLKIDDIEYCIDMKGQNVINLHDSKNIQSVNLSRGYHKIEIFSYKNTRTSGISFSLKPEKDYVYKIPNSNILYKKEPDMKILKLFNSIFRYCTNKHQYMMFANNRRLDNKEVILKFCGIDQVYDSNYMIFNRAFEEDTILDIIYTPVPVMEVYNENEISNLKGFISVDKYKLGHTLSPEYCSVFINGKKIPSSQITNINADTMHIDVNPKTRNNLTILKHNIYQNVLSDLFTSSQDAWTEATKMMTESELEKLINSSTYITNDEQDIMNLIYDEDVILWNIINNFWIKRFNLIDAENLFHYKDEEKFLKRSDYNDIPVFYSNYNYNDSNVESYIYLDDNTGYNIYNYKCIKESQNLEPSSTVIFGDFKNMLISKRYSIQVNTLCDFNLSSNHTNRFFIQLYNKYTGRYVEYPMSYLEYHPAQISDIPKCYWVRIYYNNIKLSSDYDCIRIICKLYHNNEKIKFIDKVILEQYVCCSRGIEILPIDSEVITGCELPYTEI